MVISSQKFLLIYITFLLIASFERILSTFFKQQMKPTKGIYHDWLFNLSLYGYIGIIGLSIIEFFTVKRNVNIILSLFGFIIFVSGAILRRKAMLALGDNWSIKTEIKEKHMLIERGVYKYVKHPYYLAVILELVGACLVANAFYSIALVFLVQGPLLLIRVKLEERVLLDHFGDVYKKYMVGKPL